MKTFIIMISLIVFCLYISLVLISLMENKPLMDALLLR